MRPGTTCSTLRRRLVGCGLFALLAVQWLALQHSVWHSRPGVRPSVACAAEPSAALPCWLADKALAQDGGGHEQGSPLCRLLGELVQPTPPATPLLPLPAPPLPPLVATTPAAGWSSPFAAPYSARAPPHLG